LAVHSNSLKSQVKHARMSISPRLSYYDFGVYELSKTGLALSCSKR
jgi:hypothetical protein